MAPKRAAAASTENSAAKKQKVAPQSSAADNKPKQSPKAPAKAAAATPKQAAAPAAKAAPTAKPVETPKSATETTPKVIKQAAGEKKGKKGTKVGSLRTVGKRQWVSGKKMEQKNGVLYVGHLPHGFYEYELRRYLSQYGAIKRLRVSRNAKTGRSRGYAFVQFESPNVAEKAAVELRGMYLSEKVLRAAVMKPHLVNNHIWKGTDSNHLRLLDARRRREGPSFKAKPAGAAYVQPEKLQEKSEGSIKRHDEALKKANIKYQFNPNVTL